jgi:AraC-like DNA-binding protein
MNYLETLPDEYFSHHIECYWQISSSSCTLEDPLEMFLPTCTFNIIITDQPCYVSSNMNSNSTYLKPGASLVGQTNTFLSIKSKKPLSIIGIRLKPFALANVIYKPIFNLNDTIAPLNSLFQISDSEIFLFGKIAMESNLEINKFFINELIERLFYKSMSIDERLRAQLNYIMDRQGNLKIHELLQEFKTSKVTLSKHFTNKVGLSPKKVAQIWRMNKALHIISNQPNLSYTSVSALAGFYDQSHFIKDFKILFNKSPKLFFKQKHNLIQLANLNISKRFTNQYDPKTF